MTLNLKELASRPVLRGYPGTKRFSVAEKKALGRLVRSGEWEINKLAAAVRCSRESLAAWAKGAKRAANGDMKPLTGMKPLNGTHTTNGTTNGPPNSTNGAAYVNDMAGIILADALRERIVAVDALSKALRSRASEMGISL